MHVRLLTILFVSVSIYNSLHAQVCQGSLGDPLINITFGHGSNPGPALSAATTTYQYSANDCPTDGFYTVANRTNACFGNTWHTLVTDHTGESGGYFMLVNASFQPGAFYVDTVRGLCGNTTYAFSAWVMNMMLISGCSSGGIQPNLTFTIESTTGTVLQTFNSGNIPVSSNPTWNEYGLFFTTPLATSDVVVRIVNNAPGGCGNDLALDDISFRACGPTITNTIDGVHATPQSFCEGPGHQFQLNCTLSGGFVNPEFLWQVRTTQGGNVWFDSPLSSTNSMNWVIVPNAAPGVYELRMAVTEAGNMSSLQCRVYSKPFTVTINANPVTTATNDGPVCEGKTLLLSATGGTQYSWSGPNSYSSSGNPAPINNIQQSQAGKYYVIVTNAAGCTHKDSTTISIDPVPVAATSFASATICEKDTIQVSASGGSDYSWTPATAISDATIFDPKVFPLTTTGYSVIVSNQFNCKDTAVVSITVMKKPVANAGPDKTILEGQSIQLTGSINEPGNNYFWSPATYIDNVNSLTPIVNPPVDTHYVLNVSSNFGCGTSADTMFVKVYKNIFVPSAFSPNGDGKNETWNIPALAAYTYFEVVVYDRWGQMVFRTKNVLKPWDGTYKGKPLPVGAYSYFINVGPSQDLFKGSVMIIR